MFLKFIRRALICAVLALAPVSAMATPPALDPAGAPPLSRFQAGDGTALAYRAYPGGPRVAVLLHGSAGQSLTMNPLARSLNAAGFSVYALDVRGHGASGPRGDIAYLGQLDDDLADFAAEVRRARPGADLTLVGFSAGGAFALRTAGGPDQDLFDRYVLLAPALPFPSKIARRGGGWAHIDVARIVLIMGLNRLGLHGWDGAEVARFEVPPQVASLMTPAYSYRLAMNYGVGDHRAALRGARRPVLVLVGSQDQQFYAERYGPEFRAANPKVRVQLVPGLDHVGLVTAPTGLTAITAAALRP
ncbi:alpha/beta hydrolase [Phenylobacterium sp. LjRoot164]|uniref:alpha/beta hydrolase n=1 Tax=unclassified Phenylobacterium TaxID=2640670 RepID=UPI003ECE1A45